MLATMDLTSAGIARPLASSKGGAVAAASCGVAGDNFFFPNGIGSFPSSFKYNKGLTANISAITRHTVMMKRLSVLRSGGKKSAVATAEAINRRAQIRHMRFSNFASLLIADPSNAVDTLRGSHFVSFG
jgi:hypothetical protein